MPEDEVMDELSALDVSWLMLDTSWLALAAYAIMLAIVFVICDSEHIVPRWSLRLFLAALTLQSVGLALAFHYLLTAVQIVSLAGIGWIVFAMIQDIKMHGGRDQA
jgi:hypothetical protein